MVYDEKLAGRIRSAIGDRHEVVEKKMFGGITFMIEGKMACGVLNDDFVAKIDRAHWEEAIARPHARAMDFIGRPMPGMVYVAPAGVRAAAMLRRWIDESVAFALASPARKKPAKKKPAKRSKTG